MKNKIIFANNLRGCAALSVVISHYFGVFWLLRSVTAGFIDAPILPNSITTPKFVLLLNYFHEFNWGAFGVALFFLISGFVIPFSFEKINARQFLVGRIFRIWPTYIAGFSITLLAVLFSSYFFHHPFPYNEKQLFIHYIPGIRDLFNSVNIDGVIWTLEIEVKFYLVCALFGTLLRKGSVFIFLVPLCLFLLSSFFVHKGFIAAHHLIYQFCFISIFIEYMFIGVAFNFYFRNHLTPNHFFTLVSALFFMTAILWFENASAIAFYVLWSYAIALLCFIISYTFRDKFYDNKILTHVANISYPLYVTHAMLGYVLIRTFLSIHINIYLVLFFTILVVWILSTIIHLFIEKPTHYLGKKMIHYFNYSNKLLCGPT